MSGQQTDNFKQCLQRIALRRGFTCNEMLGRIMSLSMRTMNKEADTHRRRGPRVWTSEEAVNYIKAYYSLSPEEVESLRIAVQ